MRIISKFHDYYDCVQSQGQDQTLIYLRKRRVVEGRRMHYPFPYFTYTYRSKIEVHQWIVGFCGKIYPILDVSKKMYGGDDKEARCYSLDEVDIFVETHFNKREIDGYRAKSKSINRRWCGSYIRNNFKNFFAKCKQQQEVFTSMFPVGCPIFVATTNKCYWNLITKITYNDSLKELEFFRLFDTYSAFQEIAMYLGGQAQPNNPIPKVSDRDMVVAKGFDKYSFRKDKEKK